MVGLSLFFGISARNAILLLALTNIWSRSSARGTPDTVLSRRAGLLVPIGDEPAAVT